MKTTLIRALALSSLTILPFTACQKAVLTEGQTAPKTVTRTIAAAVETPDDGAEAAGSESAGAAGTASAGTKSVFESGVGVHLTNKEYMSVYYAKNDGDEVITEIAAVIGTPDGSGKWSFSHDAIDGATSYDYAFLLPYTSKNEMPGNKKQFKIRLLNVQNPTATSFDPNVDFLLGRTQYGTAKTGEVSEVKFKRIFAPVKFEIYDGAGVLGTEKVHAVSFSLDKKVTTTDALAGLIYLTPGTSDYDNAFTYNFSRDKNNKDASNKVNMNNFSNAVSALIAGGVEKSGGAYPVWFILNPCEFPAGTKLTLCVTTDTKTVTRVVTLAKASSIVRNKINVIPIDVSGAGYSVESSGHCNFTAVKGYGNEELAMTDGTTPLYPSYSEMRYDTAPSGYPQSLQINTNGTKDSWIKLTPAKGKTLTKVRLFTNHLIGFGYAPLALKDGDTQIETQQVSYGTVAGNAGYADFTVPESSASSDDLSIYAPPTYRHWFSGITLFYAD